MPKPRGNNMGHAEASIERKMVAPPDQFIALQTFNVFKERILGYVNAENARDYAVQLIYDRYKSAHI